MTKKQLKKKLERYEELLSSNEAIRSTVKEYERQIAENQSILGEMFYHKV